MDDLIMKVLLVILGFIFGISGQIVVQVNMERRKKAAIRDLIRAEIQAFIEACENAGKKKFWDSSTVEYISHHIIQSYSNDRDRFIAAKKSSARQGLYKFYLEVALFCGLLKCIEKPLHLIMTVPRVPSDQEPMKESWSVQRQF
jgi:hypothetical protein